MALWNDVSSTLALAFYYLGFLLLVDSRVINIYSSTKPHSILANLGRDGWTNYTIRWPQYEKHALQLLSVEPQNGFLRMISKPNCSSLRQNPFVLTIESSSVSNPSQRMLNALSVFTYGEKCFRKFRRKLSRYASVGSLVMNLRDVTRGQQGLPPSSLKLRNTPARKYFMIGAKFRYLVLRKSLYQVQESDLSLDIVFPAKYSKGNKQTLLAKVRVFIDDDGANSAKISRRIRRRASFSPPRFTIPHLTARISEDARNGARVVTARAQDTNNGNAGKLTYSMSASQNLLSQQFFTIDSNTGLITTQAALDREKMAIHYFRVKAEYEQHRSLYVETDLTIFVQDVNDNAPKFESSSYSKIIAEDFLVGDTILEVRARDPDDGSNADIRYKILNNGGANSIFQIGQNSGAISVNKPLDRETVERYSLSIQASDRGTPSKTDQTMVSVIVTDVNDCVPQFSKKEYSATIPEDEKTGYPVLTVSASDKDTGKNGEVLYSFSSGNNQQLFSINRLNGQIKVNKKLDYEATAMHTLFVVAQDKGDPPQYNETSVDITLLDVNDNAPQFVSPSFQETVSEDQRVGYTFTRIQAYDNDDGSNKEIVYSIVEDNLPFAINPLTGDLYLTQKLDRENVSRYTFQIKAQDKGNPSLNGLASVTVSVRDVNDNPPRFTQSVYIASVEEKALPGATIVHVTAEDPDLDQSNVFYSFTRRERCFRISGYGVITLSCHLDYSKTKAYVLTVQARDSQLHSSAKVVINVTDSNTHNPIFRKRIYQVRISEATSVGGRVLVVSARDDDQGLNAKITYAFVKAVRDFKIDANTGVITVSNSLDRETTPLYRFEVSATDHGKPPLKGTTNVHITVTDVNDNKPRFLQSNYGKSIKENVPPGTKVVEVSATDDDEGSNKAIIYSFAQNGDGGGAFQIDSTQGVIRTLLPLDREKIPVYELTVVATDKGKPPMWSSVKVKVTLEDVRDSPPRFEKDPYQVIIKENVDVRSTILQVKAVSQDLVSGDKVTYSIVSGNYPLTFVIQRDKGNIQTSRELDFETQSVYILKVRATSSPYFVEAKVNITLIDVNDNAPVLQNFFMVINVMGDKFPQQPKFKIPAYDPDVSDRLTYQIEPMTQGNWVELNRTTGDLMVSPTLLNTGKPVHLKVRVSDGVNQATARGQILMTSITPKMLNSSLTIDIANMEIQQFFDSSYEELASSLASVIQCDIDQIALFDIKATTVKASSPDEDDSNQLKIWLVVHKANRAEFFDPQYIRDLIYINIVQISESAKLTLLPFEGGLCVTEMCNFPLATSRKSCISHTEYKDVSHTYSSSKVVFRTVGVNTGYRCTCASDYRGDKCDTVLNLCYSNPCQDNGKCVSTEESYSCICNPGRTGVNCEIVVSTSKCPALPDQPTSHQHLQKNPCKNGGVCTDLSGGGFSCQCQNSDTVDGPLCELTTRSFKMGSTVVYSALKQRWRLHITMEFVTTHHSGLLLFNGRYDGKHDFIAVEVMRGQVQFTFSLYSSPLTVRSNVNGGVSDGKWHKVEVSFQNQTGIIVVDDCKLAVAVNHGTHVGSYGCAAAQRLEEQKETTTYRSLDLSGPLMIGGLLQLPITFPVSSRFFIGCIRHVYINHKFLDLGQPLFVNGTSPKCSAMRDYCKISPCQRGNCSNILGTQQCDCPAKYGGKKCESVLKYTQSFLGTSFNKLAYSSANTLPWTLSLRFRTAKPLGSLVETLFSSGTSALLAVVNGKLTYNFNNELVLLLPHIEVNDTRWHSVEVLWTQTSVNITVDFIYKIGVVSAKGNDLGGVKQFFIGALRNSTSRTVFGGFTGCIEGLSLGIQIDTNLGINHNTRSGCSMPKHCQSNPCPSYSTCEEQFDSYKCLCPVGYVGKQCVDVCSLKPCRHGQCIRTRDSKKGFKCNCPKEYTGEYCEVHMEIPCPDKFFSASNIGVCGPCMCAVGMNLNPVCNKDTGECYCNPKHYRKILRYRYVQENVKIPVFSEDCFKCDCEEIGSLGGYCSVRNGQCPCQSGKDGAKDVIGRQCNQCADKQGEITSGRGCVVINTSCPKAYAEEIWWRRVSFGATARQKCPFGSSGFATRVCDVDDGWQTPNVLECVSNSFLALQKQLSNLTSGVVNWSPEFALGLARKLELAITLSPRLYSEDIVIALTIITTLFDYESQQNSSTLVSASTNEFATILLQSASMLFNSDNKEVWNTVQENSAGTAALLQKMENFSGNLANNLPYLKRSAHRYKRTTENILLPYTILTPNIVLELHPIFVGAFSGLSYPSQTGLYADGPYKLWRNISNRVDLPPSFFKNIKGIKNDIGIGFMILNNVGDLLPKSFDVKIRNTKYNIEVSSDVISVSLPELADFPLPTPIRITFANQLVNRSDYICVHWNYSVPDTKGGGWSREGCSLESSNVTHTVCSCEHLTAFAVLSDLNLEYPKAEAFALRLVTYIGVAVSLALLLLAFVLFICIRKLKSNAKSIHRNLVAAIFIAELTFLVGINQTENVTICRFVAIVLHYFFCSVFSWMFVEGLHMYRRLREKRNVDMGKMSFYYFMGWGCPIIVVGISVGLATEGYGNEKFCWMSTDGTLIWTFTIPIIIVVGLNVLVFIMALYMSLEKQSRRRRRHHHHHHDDSSSNPNAGLRATAAVLPLIGVSFAFGLLLVNKDLEMFHYVFAGFALCQGLFIFVFYLLLDRSVRKEFKNVYMRWKTGDKTYGIQKPVQHFKRSYHPGEMAPLRSPYDLGDDGNATSTSTTEPSSSVRSSVTSRMTTDPSITASMPDDDDTSAPDGDAEKAKYPDNPELELARKLWEQPDKSEPSTTQPESSSDEEEERPSSPGIPSDSSDSEDEEAPTGNGWPKDNTPKKKKRKAPFYASDGPMHSTPMETPEEEPLREAERDSESSETGDEDMLAAPHKKDGPAFNSVPEIIQEKGVSGSAATSDTTPSVSESLKKKPLKSALKKPKTPILVATTEEVDATTGKETGLSDRHRHKSHRHHHEKPRSRTSSGSGEHKEKKRKFRKKMPKKKETLVEIGGEQHRVKLGDTADFQDSQV